MVGVLVLYYSRSGNTKKMAEAVADGARQAGAEARLRNVEEASVDELAEAGGVILGSPTHFGHSSGPMRLFLDKSIECHGKLAGKVGGAFASSAGIGGGNETTILDLLHALLIHGMIVEGSVGGGHYGPVSIGAPDDRALRQCRALGERVAVLAERLAKSAPKQESR
jgi:NAD(P)H dehydrogenase (quinone)